MEICNVELVGTLMQINQFKSEKNILDVILEIKSEFCHTKDEYKTEKFTVLLYKTLNFDNKNLIVGKKIKIKGKIYGNLYRNCKYRRRLIIVYQWSILAYIISEIICVNIVMLIMMKNKYLRI